MPPSHNQEFATITTLSIIIAAMLTMTQVPRNQGLSDPDNPITSKERIDQAMKGTT